jgi:hypothetical protein
MEKPRTYNGDLKNLPPALLPLTADDRWVVWPWELRTTKGGKSKWTKPPRQARDPRHNARSNDPSTWGSYADAVAAVVAGNADGIGYMLKGSVIGAIDLDHCVGKDNGELVPWAERLQNEAFGAYQEITVSGAGLRIIGKVSGPETHRKFTFDRKTGAGIELYRNTARYITVSGKEMGGPCPELPSLDELIDRLLQRHGQNPDGLDFNDAGPQQSASIDDIIRSGAPEGSRSELFQKVVWNLAGKGRSIDQITDELARYPNGIAAKYADRLHTEVRRSYEKWRSSKRAATIGGEAHASAIAWPQIFVVAGELPRVVNEAEDALLLLGREIYQRGGLLVRPVQSDPLPIDRYKPGWQLIPVVRPDLVETLCCAAQFFKYDARAKGFVVTNAPEIVAESYLARQGHWRLPVLARIINTPFLRADGSICERPGYDANSHLLFRPDGESFPPIPQRPSKDDAAAALAVLQELIATFPFVTPADCSVALSAILTTLDRHAMPNAPLHAFTSPAAGTGKSLLVDVAAILATGRRMPVISPGQTEEELEKRLGAALLAGDVAISLDNCEHPLESVFLCQALTQEKLNIRLLGRSKNVETPVNATIFATGNNITIVGDLTRRTIKCALDAHCEHPERRNFNVDVIKLATVGRAKLVAAALTVLRAWHVAGETIELPPVGSFEQWSQRIRAPLLWLGQADPFDTTLNVQTDDPLLVSLATVVAQWRQNIGIRVNRTVQQVINCAINVNDFHVALLNVAQGRSGSMVSNERLGRWLKKNEARVVTGLMFKCRGRLDGYPTWSLVQSESGDSGVCPDATKNCPKWG